MMDELSLFTIALGLENPWKVVDIKFSKDKGRCIERVTWDHYLNKFKNTG